MRYLNLCAFAFCSLLWLHLRAEEPVVKKAPLPTVAQQKEAEKTIREIFNDDFAKSAAADKSALARKLIANVAENADDPAARFTLLSMSANLAAEAADLDVACASLDKLAASFDGDLKPLQKSVLGTLVDRIKDANVSKLAMALKLLLDKPLDPAANLTAGKYYFFVKGDFERGVPLLAQGAAPALSALAKKDSANPQDAVAQVAVGDAWWQAADTLTDAGEKRREIQRAAFWYAKAQPALTGLQKIKVEKRLDAAATVETAAKPTVPSTSAPPVANQPSTPNSPSTPTAEGAKKAEANVSADAEAELKKAGWTGISGTWKKTGPGTFEGTDGHLEAAFVNGSIDCVLDRDSVTRSVCIYARCSPRYKAGYGWVIKEGKTKIQNLALDSIYFEQTTHFGEPVETMESAILPKDEKYLHVGVTINGQTLELMMHDKRELKSKYARMSSDGVLRITVHGTATIINPRCSEIK